MVTKVDIRLEDIVKSTKTAIFTLITFTAMTLLPTVLFGNYQKKSASQVNDVGIEQSHIAKGKEYLKQSEGQVSSEESINLLNKANYEFASVLKNDKDNCEAIHGLGQVDLKAGYPKEAVKNLEKAVKCNKNEETLLDLCNAYKNLGKYKKAEKYANEALEINSSSYKAYNKLGLIYFKQNKYDKAAEKFEKVLKIKSDYAPAIANLADIYSKQGKFDEAFRMIDKAIEIEPKRSALYWIKGQIYQRKGEECKGIVWFEKAIELAPYADNFKRKLKEVKSKSNCN